MYLHTVMSPQQLERRALSMVRGLSDQLRSSCSGVVSSAQGLPATVQDQLTSAKRSAEELHSSLGTTSNLTPLLLQQSRHQLTQVRVVFHPFQTVLYFCCLSLAENSWYMFTDSKSTVYYSSLCKVSASFFSLLGKIQ